jgi:signal transduction histidine kinase
VAALGSFATTLAGIADRLAARRDAVLAAWAASARRDPEQFAPATLSRTQFYDHIPQMLDALVRALRATSLADALDARRDEADNAEGHGVQRWQQGYDEGEVMREWISLNACLADELHAYAAERLDADARAMAVAWRFVSEFTVTGMAESVGEYSRLLRTEAAGRVQALEEAMHRLSEVEQQRAALWRQAAHDLRGNVGVVRNVTEVLRRSASREGVAADSLELLERSVASLHALLDDLTMQARLDAGQEAREIASFDAAGVLRELCAANAPVAHERGLYLRCHGPDPLQAEGDAVKVRRIAQNLIQNAIGYTRAGGIDVTWEETRQPPKRWVLCVKDTGPGLPPDQVAPLSSAIEAATRGALAAEADAQGAAGSSEARAAAPTLPSRSVAPSAHGEGVGLSIVKRLCELLDASIELATGPAKGTTFRVTFPSHYRKG